MLHSEEQYLKDQTTARKKGQIFAECNATFFLLPQPRRLSRQYIPTEHPSFRYLRGPSASVLVGGKGLKKIETITFISIKTDPSIGYSIVRSITAGTFMASSLNPRAR